MVHRIQLFVAKVDAASMKTCHLNTKLGLCIRARESARSFAFALEHHQNPLVLPYSKIGVVKSLLIRWAPAQGWQARVGTKS